MMFTNPIWLWGLTGLIIPVAIHLLSRKESKVIKLGSVRHIQNTTTKQSVSFRLNEFILLLIRCALITLLVLLLSGFHAGSFQPNKEKWLVIEAGLENDQQFSALRDSLAEQGYEVRELSNNFPAIAGNADGREVDYWNLLEDLNDKDLEKVVVLSWNKVRGFHGKRIPKPANIIWISKETDSVRFPLQAITLTPDSVLLRTGRSNSLRTAFENNVIMNSQDEKLYRVDSVKTISVDLISDEQHAYEKQIVLAALQALGSNQFFNFDIKTSEENNGNADWTIWLSAKAIPKTLSKNIIKTIEGIHMDNAPLIVQREDCQNCWSFTKTLNEENALKYQLPLALAATISSDIKTPLDSTLSINDRRIQSEEVNWSHSEQAPKHQSVSETTSEASSVIAGILILLLLIERILAFQRNQ